MSSTIKPGNVVEVDNGNRLVVITEVSPKLRGMGFNGVPWSGSVANAIAETVDDFIHLVRRPRQTTIPAVLSRPGESITGIISDVH